MIFKKIKSLVTGADESNLTQEELEHARAQYALRVDDFSKNYTEGIESLEGETLEAKQINADTDTERVVVTESEHASIVSELKGWTKDEAKFPVRIWKTWKALPTACPECADMNGTTIDVTALFIDNQSKEIYEVQSGGLHDGCECVVRFEIERNG